MSCKKRAKDSFVLRMEWPFAMTDKTGNGTSLEKGKSHSFTLGWSSVRCLLNIKIYVLGS